MKNLDQTVKDVERDLVVNIALSIKYKRMSVNKAKKLAKDFVSEVYENYETLFSKLHTLSNSYKEARKVYVKYAPSYYEQKRILLLRKLRQEISQQRILWKN